VRLICATFSHPGLRGEITRETECLEQLGKYAPVLVCENLVEIFPAFFAEVFVGTLVLLRA
jgi:hypothetical protein